MKTDKYWVYTFGLCLSLCALHANADQAAEDELLGIYGSEELISIATGQKQPVSKAPAVASVIRADEIRKIGATDIDDVLETIPGLHVSYDHQGYFPIYTFRGIRSAFNSQVLFLVNGIPQTNLFTGGKHLVWAGMPVESIERVEIIRGPGSAIYGADAFAGVINVITRSGQSVDGWQTGVRYGSHDTKDVFAVYGNRSGDSSLSFSAEFHKTDGQDEIIDIDGQTLLDSFFGTNASRAPGSVSLSRENLDLRLHYEVGALTFRMGYQGRRDGGIGAGVVEALDPTSRFKSDRYNLDFKYLIEDSADNWDIELYGSYQDFSQEVEEDVFLYPAGSVHPVLSTAGQFPPPAFFPNGVIGNPEVFERHTRLGATFHYSAFETHDLSVGVGYYYGDLHRVEEEKNYCFDAVSCNFLLQRGGGVVDVSDTPFVFLKEADRENYYLYVQDIFNITNDWELTAGIRYDDYSDFGETVNPRLALVWSTSRKLTTKFLYGEAFRAPSFSETRNINNPAALGNLDLDPETLRSFEVAFDYRATYDLTTTFNIFYYEWDDIIQFIPDPIAGTATAQNAGKQTGYGFEAEVNWSVSPDVDLVANYSWQDSTNESTDEDVANAPGQQAYARLHWRLGDGYSLNLEANWIGDRKREPSDPRSEIDDYILTDLVLRKKGLVENLDLALIVRNLFEENAREPSPNGVPVPAIPNDLPLADRTILGEIRYQF